MNDKKKEKLEELYEIYYSCGIENPLYIESAKQFVPGDGNPDAGILFIGEAPGEVEENVGLPFQGRSGKLLRNTLKKYEISEKNSFITNVVKFRPPNNRKPTNQEIKNHFDLILFHEINIIAPKIIVPVGAVATEAVLGKQIKITEIRGKNLIHNNILIIPIFHPAYILRNMTAFSIFETDIEFIKKKLDEI